MADLAKQIVRLYVIKFRKRDNSLDEIIEIRNELHVCIKKRYRAYATGNNYVILCEKIKNGENNFSG